VERYGFSTAPAHTRDYVENAWQFLDGKFANRQDIPVTVVLKVFNDGLVSETRSSTNDSEAFLADALTAAVKELGLTFTGSMVHRRIYVSELNLACDKNLSDIHPNMRAFLDVLSEAIGTKCEPTSIGFGGDPAAQPTFRFERRVGIPFSQNYYWSLASLTTNAHIDILERLERLLGS